MRNEFTTDKGRLISAITLVYG